VSSKSLSLAIVIGVFACGLTTACSAGSGGKLGALQQLASNCPKGKLAEGIEFDASANQRGAGMIANRLTVVRNAAMWTAACGGHLRVIAFGPSSAATVTLYDGDLMPSGATENARLWRVTGMADDVVSQVEKQMETKLAKLSSQGDDPLGALDIAGQYEQELGDGVTLHVLLETSGIATNGTLLTPHSLTLANAAARAAGVSVPDLAGVSLIWAGLGRVGAGAPPSSSFVSAERSFYTAVCKKTRAASCLAISNVVPVRS